MSPVAESIRKAFITHKAHRQVQYLNLSPHRLDEETANWKPVRYSEIPICQKAGFSPEDKWMYHYLFPELLTAGCHFPYFISVASVPCDHFDEETILRIMVEAGIID